MATNVFPLSPLMYNPLRSMQTRKWLPPFIFLVSQFYICLLAALIYDRKKEFIYWHIKMSLTNFNAYKFHLVSYTVLSGFVFDDFVWSSTTFFSSFFFYFVHPPTDLWLQSHPWITPINGNTFRGRSNYFSAATVLVMGLVNSPGHYLLKIRTFIVLTSSFSRLHNFCPVFSAAALLAVYPPNSTLIVWCWAYLFSVFTWVSWWLVLFSISVSSGTWFNTKG